MTRRSHARVRRRRQRSESREGRLRDSSSHRKRGRLEDVRSSSSSSAENHASTPTNTTRPEGEALPHTHPSPAGGFSAVQAEQQRDGSRSIRDVHDIDHHMSAISASLPVVPRVPSTSSSTSGLRIKAISPKRTETVGERRLLSRVSLAPTSHITGGWAAPVLGVGSTGVLGSGAATLQGPVLTPAPAQRPPTPSLLPTAVTMTPPTPHHLQHSSTLHTSVPFSHDDYVRWLYASPTARDTALESGALARQTSGITDPATSSTTPVLSPALKAPSASPNYRGDRAAPFSTSTQTDPAHSPSQPPPPPSPDEKINYDRDFSVSTDWSAVLAAPPLMAANVSPLPSLYAARMQEREAEEAVAVLLGGSGGSGGGVSAPRQQQQQRGVLDGPVQGATATYAPSSPYRIASSSLSSQLAESQNTSFAPWLFDSPLASPSSSSWDTWTGDAHPVLTSGATREAVERELRSSSGVRADGQEDGQEVSEGLRVFVRHFQNGKVHTRPPWFLCSALLHNCEHPYYADWLDEMELGSVEEELALAQGRQGGVLGGQWPTQ